jgi:hypothetical protein
VDYPIYRKYDWLLSAAGDDARVVCSGRMCKPPDEVSPWPRGNLVVNPLKSAVVSPTTLPWTSYRRSKS